MKTVFKNSKLSSVVILGLLFGIFLPIIVTFIFFTNSYKERSAQTMNIIGQSISISATEALWFFSDEWIQIVVQSATKNHKVYSASIYDKNDLILATSKSSRAASQRKEIEIVLKKENELLGKLILIFDLDEINKDIYIEKENLLWILFLQAIISSLVLYIIIKYKVLDPIKQLIKQSKLVSNKKLDKQFNWTQKDEMGELGKAMEKTRCSLKQMFFKLEQKAMFDHLTNVYNRHGFEAIFNHEIQRCNRYKRDISMIMFDIDYFKKINDVHGHLVGDKILIDLCSLIQSHIRESDYLIRWGGEEFLILTPETNLHSAQRLAEKLRIVVEHHHFKEAGQLTISLSAAQKKPDEENASFIKRVDGLLYTSKNLGRNQVSY